MAMRGAATLAAGRVVVRIAARAKDRVAEAICVVVVRDRCQRECVLGGNI